MPAAQFLAWIVFLTHQGQIDFLSHFSSVLAVLYLSTPMLRIAKCMMIYYSIICSAIPHTMSTVQDGHSLTTRGRLVLLLVLTRLYSGLELAVDILGQIIGEYEPHNGGDDEHEPEVLLADGVTRVRTLDKTDGKVKQSLGKCHHRGDEYPHRAREARASKTVETDDDLKQSDPKQ